MFKKSLLNKFRVLSLASLSLWALSARAYHPACGQVFSTRFELAESLASNSPVYQKLIQTQVSSARLLGDIQNYQAMMGFEVLDHKPASLDRLKEKLKDLKPEEKGLLLDLVAKDYNDVKLLKYSKDGPIKSFKRHLDLIVSELSDAPNFFRQKGYVEMLPIEQILDLYFKKIQSLTHTPVVLEGRDVLMTALRLQDEFLIKKKLRGPIALYGSFVNGKAFLKSSDLDFAVTRPEIETSLREFDLLALLNDFPVSDAQAHTESPRQIHGLGYLNPIVVIVEKDYIAVRVYAPRPSRDFKFGKVPFDEYYF